MEVQKANAVRMQFLAFLKACGDAVVLPAKRCVLCCPSVVACIRFASLRIPALQIALSYLWHVKSGTLIDTNSSRLHFPVETGIIIMRFSARLWLRLRVLLQVTSLDPRFLNPLPADLHTSLLPGNCAIEDATFAKHADECHSEAVMRAYYNVTDWPTVNVNVKTFSYAKGDAVPSNGNAFISAADVTAAMTKLNTFYSAHGINMVDGGFTPTISSTQFDFENGDGIDTIEKLVSRFDSDWMPNFSISKDPASQTFAM